MYRTGHFTKVCFFCYQKLWGEENKDDIIRIRQDVHAREEREEMEIKKKYGELFLNIAESIDSFEPLLPDYENELPYHIDLARWLQNKYPNLEVELQRGSTRPDIVIEDIAIEIKGPTIELGLQSIADKCMRYQQQFKSMIVVIFDVRVTDRFYEDWLAGMKRHFPDVHVIRK